MTCELVFRVAEEREAEDVLRLRDHVYRVDLGHNPDDGWDSAGRHLVASTSAKEIVAAFRLLGPEFRPFDFEHVFDLSPIIRQGRSPAMIGKLFLSHDYRSVRHSTYILSGLLQLAIDVALADGITDYYLYTFAHLLKFYQRAQFRAVGYTLEHPDWRTLHIMHMDVCRIAGSPSARLRESIERTRIS